MFKFSVQKAVRAFYDLVALNLAIVAAIYVHFLSFLFRRFNGFTFSFEFYFENVNKELALWSKYALIFSIFAVVIFYSCGFYDTGKFKRFRERFFFITLGTLLANLLVIVLMYSMSEKEFLPRGVSLLFLLFSYITVALPRLAKPLVIISAKYLDKKADYNMGKVETVLIIGGGGYIGSVMCRHFLSLGFKVKVLDEFLFGDAGISNLKSEKRFSYVQGDCRNISDVYSALEGVDAVVHLAGLVGDPACAVDDKLTIDINYASTKVLMDLCKVRNITRFVFASTCSVYGVGDEILSEESDLNPVSLYAKTKIDSEKILLSGADSSFKPTILRFATVYGGSPRQRFDLVVNTFVAKSVREGRIEVFGGNQWRPFVHTLDIARAAASVLKGDLKTVGGEVFNVGDDDLNYQINDLADKVKSILPNTEVINKGDTDDPRNYRVSFNKIYKKLGFKCSVNLEDGIAEMAKIMENFKDLEIDITSKAFNNYSQAKNMVESNGKGSLQKIHMADVFSESWVDSTKRLSSN